MGNICSRSANKDDPTANPGRVLGSSDQNAQSQTPKRVSPPKSTNWKKTPGRTLGEPPADGAQGAADEARSNAAIAAQVSVYRLSSCRIPESRLLTPSLCD